VAGSSLIWTLSEGARDAGASVFLLGGNPGVAERAADRLVERFPGLRVVGSLCPPFGFERSEAELQRIETALREAGSDVVFVALGFPKQEHLIARLKPALPDTWFVSCGITLSFVAGDVRRAPAWVQRLGLEWLHRLTQEPRRLFRRYVLLGMPFLVRLVGAAATYRLRNARRPAVEA
jgi:N-acetylglucosaminyldiphosphoundecaprenol N-acetyl-beta-D-mannosaminyltransferase